MTAVDRAEISAASLASPFVSSRANSHVLIIEDDDEAAQELRSQLERAGWVVAMAGDGNEGLKLALGGRFDVIVLDRMLPGLDGLQVVVQLRAKDVSTPVLMVTALGAVSDRVAGLYSGGDDYLVKPYHFEELEARLVALTRRDVAGASAQTHLRARGVVVDRLTRRASCGGRNVDLLPLEFKLLEFLLLHRGEPVTRLMMLQQVWGFKFDPKTNIVETHISRLRAKLDHSGAGPIITTVRGMGYLIETDG